jgi:hypothetical protein
MGWKCQSNLNVGFRIIINANSLPNVLSSVDRIVA